MSDLLPCPFCGARPHQNQEKVRRCQLHGEPFQDFTVKCPHGCAQQMRGSRDAAIAAWNRRTPPAEVDALRAELAAAREAWARLDRLRDAVVEAAEWHEAQDDALSKQPPSGDRAWRRAEHQEQAAKMRAELAALDAHPAPRATAETVEVRAHGFVQDDGSWAIGGGSGLTEKEMKEELWPDDGKGTRFFVLTARVPIPTIITIAADATLRLDTEAAG